MTELWNFENLATYLLVFSKAYILFNKYPMDRDQNRSNLATTPDISLHLLLTVHILSLLVLKFAKVPVFVSGSTLFAYTFFYKNEINKSNKMCKVRGKHTVGGIVFYKRTFLVLLVLQVIIWTVPCSRKNAFLAVQNNLNGGHGL